MPAGIQRATDDETGWMKTNTPIPSFSLNWSRFALGMACGALFIYLIARSVNVPDVLALMGQAMWIPLLVGLAAYSLDFVLRAVRFWILLDGKHKGVPLAASISPFIASFGISDILPFRLGDVYRVFWFNRRFDLPVGTLLGSMLLERLLDLISLLFLAAAAFAVIDIAVDETLLWIMQAVIAVAAIFGLSVLAAPTLLSKIAPRLTHGSGAIAPRIGAMLDAMAQSLAAFGNLRRMAEIFVLSMVIWLLESAVLLGAWISLGGTWPDWGAPFFAFSAATLGTLVPALPGHFGSYEYFGILAFDAAGVDRTLGAAAILLSHLILWLPTAAFGVGWLLMSGRKGNARIAAAG